MTSRASSTTQIKSTKHIRLLLRRLLSVALRHAYLHLESWPRFVEMLYWPIINMATWGFTSLYFIKKFTDTDISSGALVGGAILVEIFIRTSTTMLMLFLEEVWSRNLGHLFASPISFSEYVFSLITVCFVRVMIAITPAILLAKFLFGFSLASFGMTAIIYVVLLAFSGFWYGLLIVSLLLRYGLAAEWMAWMGTWLIVPLIAPYYPVAILPLPLQYIAHALPQTYIFESMKSLINQGSIQPGKLFISLGLNVLYMLIATLILNCSYQGARQRGGLLQMGE